MVEFKNLEYCSYYFLVIFIGVFNLYGFPYEH